MAKRKGFSPEFKREAVRLLETVQKSSADLARELGVRRNQLTNGKNSWVSVAQELFLDLDEDREQR